MKPGKSLKSACACGLKAYDSQAAAETALDKVQRLGLRKQMPEKVISCRFGVWHLADPVPPVGLARTTEISPVSDRRKAENKLRRQIAYATFGRNPRCHRPGCPAPARDCHEPLTRGRGGSITDPENMVPLCGPCHDEIQLGPEWAYELGLMAHSYPDAYRSSTAPVDIDRIEQRGDQQPSATRKARHRPDTKELSDA